MQERAMTSPVTITFNNCTITSEVSMVDVGNGSITMSGDYHINLAGTFGFSMLDIQSTRIQLANDSGTAAVTGTLTIPINPDSGSNPATITVSDFIGEASVAWNGNPGYATLSAGTPLPLNGLT
jgi:hypothetical protein